MCVCLRQCLCVGNAAYMGGIAPSLQSPMVSCVPASANAAAHVLPSCCPATNLQLKLPLLLCPPVPADEGSEDEGESEDEFESDDSEDLMAAAGRGSRRQGKEPSVIIEDITDQEVRGGGAGSGGTTGDAFAGKGGVRGKEAGP